MNVAYQHFTRLTVRSDEEAPADFKEETWQREEGLYHAFDEPIHSGPGNERSGRRKRRRRPRQRRGQQDYDDEQPEQPEHQPQQQHAYGDQYPHSQYNPLSQYPSPQPYDWSTLQPQPYTQQAVPLPLQPLNYMSASVRHSESSQYAAYGPVPSPYAPSPHNASPNLYAQGPPITQHPPSYAPAPFSCVQPSNPASTQASSASHTYMGRPQGVRKFKKGPSQVPNPPGAKKRRKRLEAINKCLAKGKSELNDLEKQVGVLRAWYKSLEGEKVVLEEVGAGYEGGLIKAEEMDDEGIDFGEEEEEGGDGGVRVDGELGQVDEEYGEPQH